VSGEDAGLAEAMSPPVGSRCFRDRGGMPSVRLATPSGRDLSFAAGEEITLMRVQGAGVRHGEELGRAALKAGVWFSLPTRDSQ